MPMSMAPQNPQTANAIPARTMAPTASPPAVVAAGAANMRAMPPQMQAVARPQ